jgi:hypothetical protein
MSDHRFAYRRAYCWRAVVTTDLKQQIASDLPPEPDPRARLASAVSTPRLVSTACSAATSSNDQNLWMVLGGVT